MDEFGFTIEGLDNCIEKLRALPTRLVTNAFGKALVASAVPMVEALEARTPVNTGLLKESIKSEIGLDSSGHGGQVSIGFGSKESHIANWIERGFHLTSHEPDKKLIKDIPAKPFMRPALAASGETAIDAFKTSLLASLEAGEV
jgi:HK97 gp10 family phage protein